MIERRELTQVTAGTELAERLLATARQHVASARLLADSDPYLAYAEYPGPTTYIDEDAVTDDLPKAEAVIEAAAKALPHLPVFTI